MTARPAAGCPIRPSSEVPSARPTPGVRSSGPYEAGRTGTGSILPVGTDSFLVVPPVGRCSQNWRVDLNSDLGEGFGVWTLGDDDALLDVVTSANIACGFHGGDPGIMRRNCAISVKNGVAIGAQVI